MTRNCLIKSCGVDTGSNGKHIEHPFWERRRRVGRTIIIGTVALETPPKNGKCKQKAAMFRHLAKERTSGEFLAPIQSYSHTNDVPC